MVKDVIFVTFMTRKTLHQITFTGLLTTARAYIYINIRQEYRSLIRMKT